MEDCRQVDTEVELHATASTPFFGPEDSPEEARRTRPSPSVPEEVRAGELSEPEEPEIQAS